VAGCQSWVHVHQVWLSPLHITNVVADRPRSGFDILVTSPTSPVFLSAPAGRTRCRRPNIRKRGRGMSNRDAKSQRASQARVARKKRLLAITSGNDAASPNPAATNDETASQAPASRQPSQPFDGSDTPLPPTAPAQSATPPFAWDTPGAGWGQGYWSGAPQTSLTPPIAGVGNRGVFADAPNAGASAQLTQPGTHNTPLPLASVASDGTPPQEPIPPQGAGPRFTLGETGQIALAPSSDLDAAGNEIGRIRQFLPLVRRR